MQMIFCIAILTVVFISIRRLVRKSAEDCKGHMETLFQELQVNGPEVPGNPPRLGCRFDLKGLIGTMFSGKYIEHYRKESIKEKCLATYRNALATDKKIKLCCLKPDEIITGFIRQYPELDTLVKEHNERYISNCLTEYSDFFDHVLKYPLDSQQRRSIVSEETNCLVVSSAGSGKTSSIIGKVEYLVSKRKIAPEKILLISYTNKAAAELTERMQIPGLRGYTFHKLALDLIGSTTKRKPDICENTDRIFSAIYRDLINDRHFREAVIEYLAAYQTEENDWEKKETRKKEALREEKQNGYKSIFPDMDGHPVHVRSRQEQTICFILTSLGIRFRYEEPYEQAVSDDMHCQYKPDFSIHFTAAGQDRRIYLEHFGIDDNGNVPTWFAKDKGITYEEANRKYNDGITWKRAVHQKFGTTLIETSSADFSYRCIKERIKEQLTEAGVPFREIPSRELYGLVLPPDSRQEKTFIRLTVTFITLMKTNCRTIEEVMDKSDRKADTRNSFIIRNIIAPVYGRYQQELSRTGQKDFTDLILEATALCNTSRPCRYDYIIVDEFQDISIDRYRFLLALRAGDPPAKLYCVGDDWQSIYRFSGSDMSLFNRFEAYFGPTDMNKIETTYRFGNPLVSHSSRFIQRNPAQIRKNIRPVNDNIRTELTFQAYDKSNYTDILEQVIASIPEEKSIFLLGRYSFDDYYLSHRHQGFRKGNRFYYRIQNRDIEFLTVHKSKGLEADYIILLQCNTDVFGFPSGINDDPVLNLVLSENDAFPYGEERRLFYVAITRAKVKTIVFYDRKSPSIFVNEFMHPEQHETTVSPYRNANKHWTAGEDRFLMQLYREGKSIRCISQKMGRSQTAIVIRLRKWGEYRSQA